MNQLSSCSEGAATNHSFQLFGSAVVKRCYHRFFTHDQPNKPTKNRINSSKYSINKLKKHNQNQAKEK